MTPNPEFEARETRNDELRRYGLDHNPDEEHDHELDLLERYDDGPRHVGGGAAREITLRRFATTNPAAEPVHQPQAHELLEVGDTVIHQDSGPGEIVRHLADEGAAVVRFQGGESVVDLDALRPKAA